MRRCSTGATPNCERGYIGKWQLRDSTLWMVGFYAWRDGRLTRLADLFDGQREVAAEWFSGSLVVAPAASEMRDGAPFGKRTLTIEAGRIVGAGLL